MWTRRWFLEQKNKIENYLLFRIVVKALAFYGVVPYIVFGIWLIFQGKLLQVFFLGISASIARFISSPILETFVSRARPYQKLRFKPHESKFFSQARKNYDSFPSDHTAFLSALALGLSVWYPEVGIAAMVIAILVGLCRVLIGHHYLTDIIGGIFVGAISFYITYYFFITYVAIDKFQ